MVGQSYLAFKKSLTTAESRHFDVIIIGSGTGGLSAASFLAQEGKRVLVLEQHYVIGGYTHSFQRNGYIWDVGLHYVGQVNIPGTLLNKVFRYISKEKLKWEPLDDIYDRAVFGEKEYQFPKGRENLKAKLKEYFPDQKDQISIDKYFKLLDDAEKISTSYYAEKVLPPFLSKVFGGMLRSSLLKTSDKITLDVLKGITDNQKLIGVLTAQYGDYGLEPSKSSFYMHALLANHYMEGGAYPVGGASQFAETTVPVIEETGGATVFRASVKEILVENNKAIGVRMHDGEKFYAKTIVSAAGIVNTYSRLLPDSVMKQHQLDKKLAELEPSSAHVGMYIGIKESTSKLNLPKCNYWIFPDKYDHALERSHYKDIHTEIPVTFVSFPSAKDPLAETSHPGRTTAEVVILVPHNWFDKWKDTKWKVRNDEYKAIKEELAQKMLQQLYRVAPQLKGKIDCYEVSTPLSTEHFSGHPKGEIYGAAATPKRFRQRFLSTYTPVKNLFLSGQDVMTASIAGGTMGGMLCASAILKKNLLWTVNRKIR